MPRDGAVITALAAVGLTHVQAQRPIVPAPDLTPIDPCAAASPLAVALHGPHGRRDTTPACVAIRTVSCHASPSATPVQPPPRRIARPAAFRGPARPADPRRAPARTWSNASDARQMRARVAGSARQAGESHYGPRELAARRSPGGRCRRSGPSPGRSGQRRFDHAARAILRGGACRSSNVAWIVAWIASCTAAISPPVTRRTAGDTPHREQTTITASTLRGHSPWPVARPGS